MSSSTFCHIGIRVRNCPCLAFIIVAWPITVVVVSCYRHGLVICLVVDFTPSSTMFVALFYFPLVPG